MKQNIKVALSTVQSLVLATAVLLSSSHAKDVMKPDTLKHNDIVKVHVGDDGGLAKVSTDLHNHVDKQTVKVFSGADNMQQADRRSLQLLEKEGRDIKTELKVGAAIWLRMLAAKLML